MRQTAKLSSRYQIAIPKAIRKELHWDAGQTLAFIPKGEGVLLIPVPEIDDLRGIAKGADTTDYRDRADRY